MAQTGYPVSSIDPVAPGPSILTAARPLSQRVTVSTDGVNETTTSQQVPYEQWSMGVSWSPVGCNPAHNVNQCVDPALGAEPLDFDYNAYPWMRPRVELADPQIAVKPDAYDAGGVIDVNPFFYLTALVCTRPVERPGDLDTDAKNLVDAQAARAIARALWLGDGLDADAISLRSTAVDITDAAGDTLAQAMASLYAHYEAATGGLGGATYHIPAELIFAAGSQWLIRQEGNLYRSQMNSLVSPGPGYPIGESEEGDDGFGPGIWIAGEGGNVFSGFAGNDADEAWLYISGPVEYALAQPGDPGYLLHQGGDLYTRQQNRYETWAERLAIVRFDPCAVFACKITNPAVPEVVSP